MLRLACRGRQAGGHRVLLHPLEQELREARQEWQRPEVRRAYRQRTQCERLVDRMTRHGGRKAAAWGLQPAHLQAHVIALVCNLKLLAERVAGRKVPVALAA